MSELCMKGLEKASKEAQNVLNGKVKIDFKKECLVACPVCKLTTVHRKVRRSLNNSAFCYTIIRVCEECGNEVNFKAQKV